MKKIFILFLFPCLFQRLTAQNGILAIARYTHSTRPILDENDQLPEYEGGIDAFKERFTLEFTFPASALESGKGGEGIIGFTIDTLGNIQDVEVIDAISPDIDAEAVSILSAMPQFHLLNKPLKLAVLYGAYPSIFKQQERKKQMDVLIQSRKASDWLPFIDKSKYFAVFSAHLGATIPTEGLNQYIRPTFQLSGQIDVFKNRWGAGASATLRGSRVRKDFEYDNYYWNKDSSIGLNSIGIFAAYRLAEEERLTFTPFVGFKVHFLALTLQDNLYKNPGGESFLPTIGATVDITRKQKAVNNWGLATPRLNTKLVRLYFAINFANFKDDRKGTLVDFGIGVGWHSRALLDE